MQLEALRSDVDPADPCFAAGVFGTKPRLPARKRFSGGFRTSRDDRDVLAALGEKLHLARQAIKSGSERVERVDEIRSFGDDLLREFSRTFARGKPEPAEERDDCRARVAQVGYVAQFSPRDRFGVARELHELPRAGLLAEKERRRIG